MNPNTYVTLCGLQIMCSSLRLREEIDVGYVLFEDLQEKMQVRLFLQRRNHR